MITKLAKKLPLSHYFIQNFDCLTFNWLSRKGVLRDKPDELYISIMKDRGCKKKLKYVI